MTKLSFELNQKQCSIIRAGGLVSGTVHFKNEGMFCSMLISTNPRVTLQNIKQCTYGQPNDGVIRMVSNKEIINITKFGAIAFMAAAVFCGVLMGKAIFEYGWFGVIFALPTVIAMYAAYNNINRFVTSAKQKADLLDWPQE